MVDNTLLSIALPTDLPRPGGVRPLGVDDLG
jgi:hypothetical protein